MGLLIPFLLCPKDIVGRHILFKVDNKAVVFGWENGHVRGDKSATEVLKCVAYLAAYTGTMVYVEHVPRVSDEMADLADELSRKKETNNMEVNKKLEVIKYREIGGEMLKWLENPCKNGNLTEKILKEIRKIV